MKYPDHGKIAGAAGAGGGYCDIVEYKPPTVVKCIFAELINKSKNIEELLFGKVGNGVHTPGESIGAETVDIFCIEPIAGNNGGGNKDDWAPVQYPIIAGPMTSNKVKLGDNWVCINNNSNVDCINSLLPFASGTLFIISKPLFTAKSYELVNALANPDVLLPNAFVCIEDNNVVLNTLHAISSYLNNC